MHECKLVLRGRLICQTPANLHSATNARYKVGCSQPQSLLLANKRIVSVCLEFQAATVLERINLVKLFLPSRRQSQQRASNSSLVLATNGTPPNTTMATPSDGDFWSPRRYNFDFTFKFEETIFSLAVSTAFVAISPVVIHYYSNQAVYIRRNGLLWAKLVSIEAFSPGALQTRRQTITYMHYSWSLCFFADPRLRLSRYGLPHPANELTRRFPLLHSTS